MIYNGTAKAELIYWHLDGDKTNVHFIAMEIDDDEPVFYVRTCCNEDWEWKFHYTVGNYEMVKHAIWDAGFDSADMEDMLWALDDIFEDIFEDIVIWDEECEATCDCESGCNCCNCK
jgi:hypothetical protein